MMIAKRVKEQIEQALPGAQAVIRDFTGSGDHLEANVIWPGFAGMSRVQQHRKVYEALSHLIGDGLPIHAFTMKTWPQWPEELEKPSQAYTGEID